MNLGTSPDIQIKKKTLKGYLCHIGMIDQSSKESFIPTCLKEMLLPSSTKLPKQNLKMKDGKGSLV